MSVGDSRKKSFDFLVTEGGTDKSRLKNIFRHSISKLLLINLNFSELAKFRESRLKDNTSDIR